MPEWSPPVRFAALAQAYPGECLCRVTAQERGRYRLWSAEGSVMGRYPAGLCMKPMGLPLIRRWETM